VTAAGAPTGLSAKRSVSHLRTRSASPMREYFPAESRNTMISLRPARLACITRQRPASLMKPVFCRPMSQAGLRTRPLVLRNCAVRWPISTAYSCEVDRSRISGNW
jgi:hypothetical protein